MHMACLLVSLNFLMTYIQAEHALNPSSSSLCKNNNLINLMYNCMELRLSYLQGFGQWQTANIEFAGEPHHADEPRQI